MIHNMKAKQPRTKQSSTRKAHNKKHTEVSVVVVDVNVVVVVCT